MRGRLGPPITRLTLDALQIDAVEQHGQVGGADLDAVAAGWSGRKTEAAFFEAFVPDRQTVAIPLEDLDAVTAASKNVAEPDEGV